MSHTSNSGNVLFLILIAVALFAALSFAVTQSARMGGNSNNQENMDLAASEILGYAAYVKTQVDRMRIVNNIELNEIDFGSDVFLRHSASPSNFPDNPNCSRSECRVFATNGGSSFEKTFDEYVDPTWTLTFASTHPAPGHPWFRRVSVIDVSTDAEDIVMMLTGLDPDVCEAINDNLGIESPGTESWPSHGSADYYNPADTLTSEPLGDERDYLHGQHLACFRTSAYDNVFFKVLVAR